MSFIRFARQMAKYFVLSSSRRMAFRLWLSLIPSSRQSEPSMLSMAVTSTPVAVLFALNLQRYVSPLTLKSSVSLFRNSTQLLLFRTKYDKFHHSVHINLLNRNSLLPCIPYINVSFFRSSCLLLSLSKTLSLSLYHSLCTTTCH